MMLACTLFFSISQLLWPSLWSEKIVDLGATIDRTTFCDKIERRERILDQGSFSKPKVMTEAKKDESFPIYKLAQASTKNRFLCGPRVLIIGAMKCGTNTVGQILRKHPRVKLNTCDLKQDANCDPQHYQGSTSGGFWGMHGFTHLYNRFRKDDFWIDVYTNILSSGEKDGANDIIGESISIDKSPSYFNTDLHPGVELRVRDMLPHAKIIITLCDPTGRLYSHFHHNRRADSRSFEKFYNDRRISVPSNFSEFVALFDEESVVCQNQPLFCDEHRSLYLRLGEYHKDLQKWRNAFGDESILVLNMQENQLVQTHKILEHLGSDVLPKAEYPWETMENPTASFVNPMYPGRASGYKEHAKAMQWLKKHYLPHNRILAQAINQPWPLEWS